MNIGVVSGASSGIGLEITKLLDKENLDELWLIALSENELDAACKNLTTKTRFFGVDLSKSGSLSSFCEAINQEKPSVKYLVCSAGVGFNGALLELTPNKISKMTDIIREIDPNAFVTISEVADVFKSNINIQEGK